MRTVRAHTPANVSVRLLGVMASDYPGFAADGRHPCAMDATLNLATRQLLTNSLSEASRRAYTAGQECFLDFCHRFRLHPVPASDETLTYFVGHMRRRRLAHGTARQYLAAVRRLHLQWGRPMPPGLPPFTDAAMRGYPQRLVQSPARPRHALTIEVLCLLKTRLAQLVLSPWDQRCIWAACTMAFYGGLRSSEYLVTAPGRGLRRCDVSITPDACVVRMGIQKTQQHGSPSWISLPATGTATCPVRSVSQFVAARDAAFPGDGALFVLQDGSLLTRPYLNLKLRETLGPGFSSHSLRIGIATSACAAGADDSVIQRLGRWTSGAYNGYVRSSRPAIRRALLLVAARGAPAQGAPAPAQSYAPSAGH